MKVTTSERWYVQEGARAIGPFSADQIGRFLLTGHVQRTDRVSRDGDCWEPVTQVPELVPEALLDMRGPTPGLPTYPLPRDDIPAYAPPARLALFACLASAMLVAATLGFVAGAGWAP